MRIVTHYRNAEKYIDGVSKWDISEKEKKEATKFLNEYLAGRITQKRGNNPDALIEKVSQTLRVCLENIKEPTEKEIQKFFDNLVVKQKIKSYDKKAKTYTGKPYSQRSQVEIISTLRRYLTWRYEKPQLLTPLKIKIGIKEKDIESLTLNEIERLYEYCKTDEERYIISGLFSTGCRIEEFLSIRLCDITLPAKDEFIKVVVRNESSKTKGRTISLYWLKTLESFPKYIQQRRNEGIKPTDYLLTKTYTSLSDWIRRIGNNALGKRVHAHMFRHSCADWLASRLNRQQLCIYFGWSFSSNMADVYINRQNVNMLEVDKKEHSTNYQEVKDKLAKQEYESKLKEERLEELNKKIEEQNKQIEEQNKQNKKILKYFESLNKIIK